MLDLVTANKPLQPLNTLALPATAAYYLAVHSEDALVEALAWAQQRRLPVLVLGGGSNVVLDGDWPGLVLHICLQGITRVEDDADGVLVRVAAGENWNDLVHYCLQQGWYGLENLVLIPGRVGAAPIQNIGAYGVELSRFLESVEGFDSAAGERAVLSHEQCELAYRDSVFKHRLKDRFVITAVNLRLSTQPAPELGYGDLAAAFDDPDTVTPPQLAAHITGLRQAKLPDPALVPNAGSFFKNPVLSAARAAQLRREFPGLVSWPLADGQTKLAAAWLVEHCGWKGRHFGNCGVHERQAIVLTHNGRGVSAELLKLSTLIIRDIKKLFDVDLEIEPSVYHGS